jgi:ubiquinone/menaquinone biosynthesis C-methylase UbiE
MSVGGRIFAALYDSMLRGTEKAGLADHRRSLLSEATGHVLEIGAGTGANLPYYGDRVESLTVTEPEAPMARKLEGRIREQSRTVELVAAPAEKLPFEDGRFDTVVSTLVLCTVEDQTRALGELGRVLKAGGRLLFIEHLRADTPGLARWQDRLNGVSRVMGHGCNCNRSTLEAIRAAGFEITGVKHGKLPKSPPTRAPLAIGTATS